MKPIARRILALVSLTALPLLAGCASSSPRGEAIAPRHEAANERRAEGVTMAQPEEDEATWRIFDGMDDAQITAALLAIDEGVERVAHLGATLATEPSVARLGRDTAAIHGGTRGQVTSFLERRKLTPTRSAVSDSFDAMVAEEVALLAGNRAGDFDRRYVIEQIHQHTEALRLVDRILPHVENADLARVVLAERRNLEERIRTGRALAVERGDDALR